LSLDAFAGVNRSPITLNKYLYGNANPTNFIDSTGYMGLREFDAASTIQAILATTTIVTIFYVLKPDIDIGSSTKVTNLSAISLLLGLPLTTNHAQGFVNSQARTLAPAVTLPKLADAGRRNGHHTIPIYMCGALVQQLAPLDAANHSALVTIEPI